MTAAGGLGGTWKEDPQHVLGPAHQDTRMIFAFLECEKMCMPGACTGLTCVHAVLDHKATDTDAALISLAATQPGNQSSMPFDFQLCVHHCAAIHNIQDYTFLQDMDGGALIA